MTEQQWRTLARVLYVVKWSVRSNIASGISISRLIQQPIDRKRIYKVSAFEPSESELDDIQKSLQNKTKAFLLDDESDDDEDLQLHSVSKGKGKGKAEETTPEDILEGLDIDEEELEPSSKMLKMVCFVVSVLPNSLSSRLCY